MDVKLLFGRRTAAASRVSLASEHQPTYTAYDQFYRFLKSISYILLQIKSTKSVRVTFNVANEALII